MNIDSCEFSKPLKQFIVVLTILSLIGIIMVYSSSYIYAREVYGNSGYYFYKQLAYLALSLCILFVMTKTKSQFWINYGLYINITATIILFLTLLPGIGTSVKGASRWIRFGSLGFQPGEIIKYTLLISSIKFFESFDTFSNKQKINYAASLIAPLCLFILQPDFGSFTISFFVLGCVCFLSKFSRKRFYITLSAGIVILIVTLFAQPYRVRRIFAFLDPWKNAKGSGFQIIQSYLAFANGAIFGQGIGNSNEKLFYLPEAHNDFIFSVVGEEFGFFGVFVVIAMFILLLYYGFKMTLKMENRYNFILAGSVIFMIGIQALLNMGVVLGLLPTKGMNLPFISSGGSSLMANFFGIGLFLSAVYSEIKSRPNSFTETYSSDRTSGNFKVHDFDVDRDSSNSSLF